MKNVLVLAAIFLSISVFAQRAEIFEENGKLIQTMRVVTGKANHPTPIFSDTVEYIVLNPYWNVPKSIIQKEFVPKLIRNSNAMKRKDRTDGLRV